MDVFLFGLVAGVVGGLVAGRRLFAPRRGPHIDAWQRALARKRGEVRAALLAARVQARYDELYARRPRFTNLALRAHLEGNILPGLALYQVLCEEHEDGQEAALAELEALFEAAFADRSRRVIRLLGRLPDPFPPFRRLARLSMRGFPPEGWEVEWVEDSDLALAFNMRSCFYLEVLTAYDAPELTPLYCKTDDWMFEALPPSIAWERTKTLGRGDDCCDFRWRGSNYA